MLTLDFDGACDFAFAVVGHFHQLLAELSVHVVHAGHHIPQVLDMAEYFLIVFVYLLEGV